MFEEPMEIIILGIAAFILFFEHFILIWCRHGVIKAIKERFQKHGVYIIKVFQTGGVEQSYSTPQEKFKFGKKQFSTSSFITGRHHFDTKTGKPVMVLVEGNPTNVNLKDVNINKEFPAQRHSAIVEQAIIRAENYGVTKTITRLQDAFKQNKLAIILSIVTLAAATAAAIFGYLAYSTIPTPTG